MLAFYPCKSTLSRIPQQSDSIWNKHMVSWRKSLFHAQNQLPFVTQRTHNRLCTMFNYSRLPSRLLANDLLPAPPPLTSVLLPVILLAPLTSVTYCVSYKDSQSARGSKCKLESGMFPIHSSGGPGPPATTDFWKANAEGAHRPQQSTSEYHQVFNSHSAQIHWGVYMPPCPTS